MVVCIRCKSNDAVPEPYFAFTYAHPGRLFVGRKKKNASFCQLADIGV